MESSKSVIVIGATGFLGTEICSQLKAANRSVKALVRPTSDPNKVIALQNMGVETIEGDIKDRASLKRAFANVEAVISTASSTLSRSEGDSIETVDRQGQLNVVEEAEAAGVEQFIFVSFFGSPESFPLQDAKREVENRLQSSKMGYTILRPTFFMEIWLSPALGFDAVNSMATIYGDGVNKISWIAVKDVAAFAVASLDNESAYNKIIDLGGPEALSPLEVVRLFEEQQGKSFQLQHIPVEALKAQKENAQDSLQQSFSAIMLNYAGGQEIPMEEVLNHFPINLGSVKDYRNKLLGLEPVAV